jgi:hypothetical protein
MCTEIRLKAKYRGAKPKGKYRADYMGNSGKHRHKGVKNRPVVGTGRTKTKITVSRKR